MERSKYQTEHFQILARETAHAVGCEALYWWQDKRDPHRLCIKALAPLGSERSLVVNLEAVVPKQTEHYLHRARKVLPPPGKKVFHLSGSDQRYVKGRGTPLHEPLFE